MLLLNLKRLVHTLIPNNVFWKYCNYLPVKKENYSFEGSLNGYKEIFDKYIFNKNIKSIFHIGCNTGAYLNYLSKNLKGTNFYLNDINSNLFKFNHNKKLKFIHGDILKINLINFEMILCHTLLIYLNKKKCNYFFNLLLKANPNEIYFYDYFSDNYHFDINKNLYIHAYEELDIFLKKDYYIKELPNPINLNDFQKKFIKLYLIKKRI